MLLDITNTCRMGCPHCLECATQKPQHMDAETFEFSLMFIHRSKARYVLVSGGELTEHPQWDEYVYRVARLGVNVIIPTNGMFIGTDNEAAMLGILKDNGNVVIQLTTVKGLYPRHEETLEKIKEFKRHLKEDGLKHRLVVADQVESMVELGRCCEHPELAEIARKNQRGTTSCFQAALIAAQTDFHNTIELLEARTKLCHPLIDWKGGIHWSESWLCPSFAHVKEPFDDICRKACEWRPCGKCAGYQKLLKHTDLRYVKAREILGIKQKE